METSLIITTYNRPDALKLVLESVFNQSILPNEIIIGDDGSTEETKLLIDSFILKNKVLIKHVWQEDTGFRASRIRNLAIKKASYDYLIFIDGDMILHKNFIKSHKRLALRKSLLQGHRVLLDEKLTHKLLTNNSIKLSFFTSGLKNKLNSLSLAFLSKILLREDKGLRSFKSCNFSCWKEDVYTVNGFNEKFIGWGKEDTEFIIRIMNAGIKKMDVRFSVIAYHLDHGEDSKNTTEEHFSKNLQHLETTKKLVSITCQNGLDQLP